MSITFLRDVLDSTQDIEELAFLGGNDDSPVFEDDPFDIPRFPNPHESIARFEALRDLIRGDSHGLVCESDISGYPSSNSIRRENTKCVAGDFEDTILAASFYFFNGDSASSSVGANGQIEIQFKSDVDVGDESIPSICTLSLDDTASWASLGITRHYERWDDDVDKAIVKEELRCIPEDEDNPDSRYNSDDDWRHDYWKAESNSVAVKYAEVMDALED